MEVKAESIEVDEVLEEIGEEGIKGGKRVYNSNREK